MFTRVYADNYRCFVNFELPLEDLSLLLGPNGVGKTSVLDIMFGLRQLLTGVAKVTDPEIFPTRTLTRWQSRNVQVFEVDVQLPAVAHSEEHGASHLSGKEHFQYRLEVEHERHTRKARIKLEQLTSYGKPLFECNEGEVQLYRDDHSPGPKFTVDWSESALARVAPRGDNTRLTRFLDFMRKVMVCGLYPANFDVESATEDPVLHRDARNFAAWYRHVLLERQDLVPAYTEALGQIITGFKGIRLEQVGLDTRAMMVKFEEEGKSYELRLDEISDGQRAIVALYALVRLAAGLGYTLFLDEPDNYVALEEIQPWLMELSDSCGAEVPQAVLCSHHPELMDYLGCDRGLLLEHETSGVTTTKKLDKMTWKAGLRLSELVARGWHT